MIGTIEFDARLRKYFGASQGAYSEVTATEAADGQVTVSAEEKNIVLSHFGKAELADYVGNDNVLASKGLDARREFRLFPTGEIVRPKLKYPKPDNSELRLYFNNDEFKVRRGHYWGVFKRAGEIWIFQSQPNLLNRVDAGQYDLEARGETLEDEPDDYQAQANSVLPAQSTSQQKSWNRDPRIAAAALAKANYNCELRPDLPTFASKRSGKPFVEAHHLIPMKVQGDFNVSLDIERNICALSPFAHRKIHLASFDDIVDDIKSLAAKRPALLEYARITEDELLGYYRL